MNNITTEQFAQTVADNVKSKKWLSCTMQVETDKGVFSVGVKAYGKWVQRIECCGIVDGVPEQKTVKALKEETLKLLNRIIATI